jgi:hypothetical protein
MQKSLFFKVGDGERCTIASQTLSFLIFTLILPYYNKNNLTQICTTIPIIVPGILVKVKK